MRAASRLAIAAAVAAILLNAGRAWAPYHVTVIDQVFFGTADCPNAQYVMMRMLAGGQALIAGQHVPVQNADGSDAPEFGTFGANVSNGAAGDPFIIGTPAAAALFGIAMDQVASGALAFPAGRVCFAEFPPASGMPVDCVAYGNYTGDNGTYGLPAAAPALGMALVRQEDTHDNETDFARGAAAPRNNAGEIGTLGQCPGGATPTPTTPPASACVGDCNGDGMVAINELILGVSIALGNAPLSVCPSFDCQGTGQVQINCLITAVNNALNGCPATPTPTDTTLAAATRTPLPDGALGVRRFSIDPDASRFIAVISPGASFPSTGFEGFLELTAGVPDPSIGIAYIDITDASEYLSVNVPAGGQAVCLKVQRDQLPVRNAGIVACNGGLPIGIRVTQNHNLGVVGACSGGAHVGESCGSDTDCGDGHCFTAADCTAARGTVEGPDRPHPGACNGPFDGVQDMEASAPGSVVIAPAPNGLITGLPVELIQERATPCGDEGASGPILSIGFTTGHSVGQILSYNNEAGATLSAEIRGAPFSCASWSEEDGPGTLVLSAANLDSAIAPGVITDIIGQFELVD